VTKIGMKKTGTSTHPTTTTKAAARKRTSNQACSTSRYQKRAARKAQNTRSLNTAAILTMSAVTAAATAATAAATGYGAPKKATGTANRSEEMAWEPLNVFCSSVVARVPYALLACAIGGAVEFWSKAH
jgi:hypothetical protein